MDSAGIFYISYEGSIPSPPTKKVKMKSIFKYVLGADVLFDGKTVDMPETAVLLSIQRQDGTIVLWAEVDTSPDVKIVPRSYIGCLTGYEPPAGKVYLATVQLDNGSFVVHIYH